MVEILAVTSSVAMQRNKWRHNGTVRPDFAEAVSPGRESVWDYPRPPRVEPVAEILRVLAGETPLATTHRAVRVCETAGAPAYYFPPEDVAGVALETTGQRFACEWKGVAEELGVESVGPLGWRYVAVYPEYRELYNWVAFNPGEVDCYIGDELVAAQPGGYYGGWVSANLAGPIKGESGSEDW